MVFTCSKRWKHEFVKYVKYAWKQRNNICSKSKKKAQEQHKWCCSGVFIVNFKSVSIETQSNIYVRDFFAIQRTKAKIFNRVLSTPLKPWKYFTLINWLWFGWITWRFFISFMSTFIQIFPQLILKKKNKLMLKTKQNLQDFKKFT